MKMTIRRPGANATERLVAETHGAESRGSAIDSASALAGAPIFQACGNAEVVSVLAAFDEVRFPSGRRVVLEGLRGSDFFLIVAGRAAVLVDGWRVASLGPGDFFGEIAVLGDGMRSASVRAETPLHCLVLPNGGLERLILDHPQVGINLIRTVIGRFQDVAGRRQPPVSEQAG